MKQVRLSTASLEFQVVFSFPSQKAQVINLVNFVDQNFGTKYLGYKKLRLLYIWCQKMICVRNNQVWKNFGLWNVWFMNFVPEKIVSEIFQNLSCLYLSFLYLIFSDMNFLNLS